MIFSPTTHSHSRRAGLVVARNCTALCDYSVRISLLISYLSYVCVCAPFRPRIPRIPRCNGRGCTPSLSFFFFFFGRTQLCADNSHQQAYIYLFSSLSNYSSFISPPHHSVFWMATLIWSRQVPDYACTPNFPTDSSSPLLPIFSSFRGRIYYTLLSLIWFFLTILLFGLIFGFQHYAIRRTCRRNLFSAYSHGRQIIGCI